MSELLHHFNTLHIYLVATLAHWTVCGVCGALTVQSHYRGGPMLRLLATVIATWWCLYEVTEMLRVQDQGDIDIANGLFAYVVGAGLTYAFHAAVRRLYARQHQRRHR